MLISFEAPGGHRIDFHSSILAISQDFYSILSMWAVVIKGIEVTLLDDLIIDIEFIWNDMV